MLGEARRSNRTETKMLKSCLAMGLDCPVNYPMLW